MVLHMPCPRGYWEGLEGFEEFRWDEFNHPVVVRSISEGGYVKINTVSTRESEIRQHVRGTNTC